MATYLFVTVKWDKSHWVESAFHVSFLWERGWTALSLMLTWAVHSTAAGALCWEMRCGRLGNNFYVPIFLD